VAASHPAAALTRHRTAIRLLRNPPAGAGRRAAYKRFSAPHPPAARPRPKRERRIGRHNAAIRPWPPVLMALTHPARRCRLEPDGSRQQRLGVGSRRRFRVRRGGRRSSGAAARGWQEVRALMAGAAGWRWPTTRRAPACPTRGEGFRRRRSYAAHGAGSPCRTGGSRRPRHRGGVRVHRSQQLHPRSSNPRQGCAGRFGRAAPELARLIWQGDFS